MSYITDFVFCGGCLMGCDYPNTFLHLYLFRGAILWQCFQLPKTMLLILRIGTTVMCFDLLYSATMCALICCTVPHGVLRSAVQCHNVCSDLLYSATQCAQICCTVPQCVLGSVIQCHNVCSDLLYSATMCVMICCTVPQCVL